MAIAMVRRTEAAIFIDFPGHDSYETVMQTITREDPERAPGMFHLSLGVMRPGSDKIEVVRETDIDVREQFLINTYQDLITFVKDFQSTRSGKPTRRMLAEIKDWDPNLNVQQASK